MNEYTPRWKRALVAAVIAVVMVYVDPRFRPLPVEGGEDE